MEIEKPWILVKHHLVCKCWQTRAGGHMWLWRIRDAVWHRNDGNNRETDGETMVRPFVEGGNNDDRDYADEWWRSQRQYKQWNDDNGNDDDVHSHSLSRPSPRWWRLWFFSAASVIIPGLIDDLPPCSCDIQFRFEGVTVEIIDQDRLG